MGFAYAADHTPVDARAHTGPRTAALAINRSTLKLQRVALLVVVLLAWALRLVALNRQDIWWDEARNIDVALRPFLQVAIAPELDIHPPVYFWLLHFWARLTGLSMSMEPAQMAFVTRLLSVVAGVIGVVLLDPLARLTSAARHTLWHVRWAGVVAALMGACSPFWLAESQETRMYTVGFALLLGAAVALLAAWRRVAGAQVWTFASVRSSLIVFVLLSALALLAHYNALFIVVAWYVGWLAWALLQTERRRHLTVMLACGGVMALLVAPVAPIALRQIPVYANPNLTVPTVVSYLTQNWQAYWGGYAYTPTLANGLANGLANELAEMWLWAVAAVGVAGMVLAWLVSQRKTPLLFLLLWVFGGLALYYVAVLDRGAFNVRYSSFITPALYALMGVAFVAWGRWWRPLTVVVVAVAVAIWPAALRADLFDDRFAREDIAGVTQWLREHTTPGAVVFVDQKYPFGFYYDRYVIDAAATPLGDEIAPARYLFVDINTIDGRLQAWAGDATQVYWVQWFESDTDPRRAVAFLLDQQGERGGEENFQGYSIDWWQLSPPNFFRLAPNLAPLTVTFPPAMQTVAVSLPQEPIALGGDVPVVVRWQRVAEGEVTRPLKARVALYNVDGARLSQRDERLLNDRHLLPAEWAADDQPLNVYLLDVAADLAPGPYSIGLLVYDADTLEPIGVVDAAGNPTGVEAMIGSVTIVESEP